MPIMGRKNNMEEGKMVNGKFSKEEFTKLAIERLRKGNHKGILCGHKSQFGLAFEKYFGEFPATYNPKTKKTKGWLMDAIAAGKFDGHMCQGGPVCYLKGEAPASAATEKSINATLKLITAKA
jgi:hypothetical protein